MQTARMTAGRVLLAFGLMLGLVQVTHATVLFTYSAQCLVACDTVGLVDGDLVGGTVGFDDAAVGPNAVLALTDIDSFSITYGNVSFGLANLTDFFALLDPTGTSSVILFAQGFGATAGFLIIDDGTAVDAFLVGAGQALALGSTNQLTRARAVPEPETLALLGIALMGVLVSRRRRS